MKTNQPTIVDRHDYLTINFGNSRHLTTSFSGVRAAGKVPANVWVTWQILFTPVARRPDIRSTRLGLTVAQVGFLEDCEAKNLNVGQKVRAFAEAADALWPEWGVAPRTFHPNEAVAFDFGPRRGGRDVGVVVRIRKLVEVRFERMGLVRMAADQLADGK